MVVHPASHGIPRAPWYSGSSPLASAFVYGILTLCDWISHSIRLASAQFRLSATPKILLPSVWPLPISLATTFGISVDFSSSPYLDVSVQAVPHVYLLIQYTFLKYCFRGFPHSEICGSMLMCSSPQLIAAYHVLLRLLMPRHSPCALHSLTSFVQALVWFSELCKLHKKVFYWLNCIITQFFVPYCCFFIFSSFFHVQFSRSNRAS